MTHNAVKLESTYPEASTIEPNQDTAVRKLNSALMRTIDSRPKHTKQTKRDIGKLKAENVKLQAIAFDRKGATTELDQFLQSRFVKKKYRVIAERIQSDIRSTDGKAKNRIEVLQETLTNEQYFELMLLARENKSPNTEVFKTALIQAERFYPKCKQ